MHLILSVVAEKPLLKHCDPLIISWFFWILKKTFLLST